MIRHAVAAATLVLIVAGCGGKQDPAVRIAAERIVESKGSFILHGKTIPIKTADKIPTGNLQIQKVDLNGLHTRDEEIELLKALKQLEILNLQSSYITDSGMIFLQDLKHLRELDLHGSQYFTDKGLESLQSLPRLSKLELSKTRISDAGIEYLKSLKQLSQLYLNNTQISSDAGKKLRESLPNCQIYGLK